ncbi:MAG TPA: hypothetical protein VNT60_03170 [Deinococcales bacterium]|nr:hypothetical protein [Deinococcales bacterium]
MEKLSREEATQLVLERCYGFETQRMFVDWTDDGPVVHLPDAVEENPALRARLSDPRSGELPDPRDLCVLVPEPEWAGTRAVRNGSNHLMRSLGGEPFDWTMPMPYSWAPAPDLLGDPETFEELRTRYGIAVTGGGRAWTASSTTRNRVTAGTREEAILLCALLDEGVEVAGVEALA